MVSLMFYEKPVALNREVHKNTKVGPVKDYLFAAKTNSVVLTGVEFIEACKEYAIVFARAGDKIVPMTLLGLRENENIFVDADGKWDARYIPAFARRYPFVLAETGGDELTVCIDEASAAFNAEPGEALFDAEGKNLPFLDNALNFINAYQAQFKRTEAFVQHLEKLDLFTDMNAKAELSDGRKYLLNGLLVVDEQKLKNLDKTKMQALMKDGELAWVFAHLISLSNLSRMVDKLAARK